MDVLIKNGKIFDGSGNPWFKADIGLKEGKIEELGNLKGIYADRVIEAKGFERRFDLENGDSGLYTVLRKRKLLDRVFSSIEKSRQKEAVRQVVGGLGEFNRGNEPSPAI